MVEIQAYQCSNIISYLLKLAWQLPSGTSFDHVMATACARTITLLYIYLCVWGLDLRLNNVNYSYWYFPSSTIITSLYWTSETPLSSSITTSEYLICDSIDIILYSYTLPIDHFSYSFSSICLSYNLSWAKGHNMKSLFYNSNNAFDMIVPVPSTIFQTYDITLCNTSCASSSSKK